MLAEGEETALYSDELVRSRSALYARRFRPWAFLLAGWVLFFSFGSGIEFEREVKLEVGNSSSAGRGTST